MALFQDPPSTPEEIERSKPLDIPPEQVALMDEKEWYERAFRGDAAQLTVRALVMGTILGFFLAFTNVYVGLKVGWALGVALTACIASFTIWTGLQKVGIVKGSMTILETNCMASTASSAGYATSVIAVTAAPAMLLIEGKNLPWYVLSPWILCCAALGVLMAIPMKRNMINQERLAFPSGTAAAVLLQSLYTEGKEALAKGRALLWGGLVGVSVPLLTDLKVRHGDGLLPSQSKIFDWLPKRQVRVLDPKTHQLVDTLTAPSDWLITLNHGVALVAAGAIIGLRVTLSMLLGGLLTALVLGPMAVSWVWTNANGDVVAAAAAPGRAWKDIGTWFGAPMLVSYGLITFALQFRTIARAFRSMAKGAVGSGDDEIAHVEVPVRWFVLGMAVFGAIIVALAQLFFGIPAYYGALAVFLCFFLALVACRATGETDITPGGPLGKIMQLSYGMLMPQSYTANLMTASISAGSGLASADLLNDLKSGYLLGAHPRRQFVAQFIGIFTGTLATCIGYYALIPDATAITGTAEHASSFPAPAAQQWRVVAELFKVGVANLHPMARSGIAIGLLAGVVFALVEWALPKHKKYLPSPTGIGLGLLLTFFTSVSFVVGAVAAAIFGMIDKKQAERFVIPIASGLIAGEAIVGVIVGIVNNTILK
jgi:uncharacterized oligopeptide transporter (OPT) family protein